MKIAIVMKDYDGSKGGAERYLVELVPKLVQKCENIDLIVNKVKGALPVGVNVKRVRAQRWSSILSPLSFNWSAQRVLRANQYDIVYGLTQIYPQDVYRVGGGVVHSWFRIRYPQYWLRAVNYLSLRRIVRFYIENKIFNKQNFKKIITNSHLCKDQILHHYEISPKDIKVIYNGVNTEIFNSGTKVLFRNNIREKLGIPSNDKVVLFVANNWKRKGLKGLIGALAVLRQKDVWLIVVGRGKPKVFSKEAEKLGLKNRIIFAGGTNTPEEYYGAADIFVLPTYYDPFANVCLEALSCGLPVVTTKTNGASEIIVNGENGYTLDNPSDIKDMSDKIEKAFGLKGFNVDNVVRNHTINGNVDQILSVFNEVLGGNTEDEGNILVNNGYEDLLKSRNLMNFSNVMQEEGVKLYKKNKYRSVVKISAEGQDLFLKKHFIDSKPSWALKEWQNIYRLRSLKINTMSPVAVGRKKGKSFIITESLENAQRLEDYIKSNELAGEWKDVLIKQLALLTSKMHQNNLFHKDYYTGHIFVDDLGGKREDHDKEYEIYLIDLQRLCEHNCFRDHWRIKDLASLNFSTKGSIIKNADKIRFLRYYLGDNDLSNHKRFIKKIIGKTNRITKHTKKLLARRKSTC